MFLDLKGCISFIQCLLILIHIRSVVGGVKSVFVKNVCVCVG
jgi:hypothetical protein